MNEKSKLYIVIGLIVFIIAIIPAVLIISTLRSNSLLEKYEQKFKSTDTEIVYIGRPSCPHCQSFQPKLKTYADNYDFNYLYVNTDEINSATLENILSKAEINSENFGTPYTIVIKDGKVVDTQNGDVPAEKNLFEFLQRNNFIPAEEEYNLEYSNRLYTQFEETFGANENNIIYMGRPTCSNCQSFQPKLDRFAEDYDFEYLYINTDEIGNKTIEKILAKAGIKSSEFGTPYTIITKNGKVIDKQIGDVAKEENLFTLLQKNGFISANEEYDDNNNLTYITPTDFVGIVKDSKRSVIVIGQTTCGYCSQARPILSEIVKEQSVEINYIDYDTLTATDQQQVVGSLEYLQKNNWGTPLLLVVENNALIKQLEGATTKENYIKFLKENGVIK